MLLHRFTKHVKEQNWFAVGLDFLVVVVGIIIGLQVNNWNEERKAKDTTKNYYRLLVNELDLNIQIFDNAIEYYNTVKKYAYLTTIDNNKPDIELDSNYIINAYQATQLYGPAIPRDTITEMLNSADFLKYSDKRIQRNISRYANGVEESAALALPLTKYRMNIRGLIDSNVQQQIRETCGDVNAILTSSDIGVILQNNCKLVLDEKMLLNQIKKIKLYNNLEFDLTYRVSTIDWKISNYKIFKNMAEEIKSNIKDIHTK